MCVYIYIYIYIPPTSARRELPRLATPPSPEDENSYYY